MAKPAGSVDVVRVARVDPELQAVAILDPILATPQGVLLVLNFGDNRQRFLAPSHTNVGEWPLGLQLAERRKTKLLAQLDAFRLPRDLAEMQRRGEAIDRGDGFRNEVAGNTPAVGVRIVRFRYRGHVRIDVGDRPVVMSLADRNSKKNPKALTIDVTMFRTVPSFLVGSTIILGILAALYTVFW